MASVVTYADGLRRIEFSLTPNGPRKTVRLGRVNMKTAESWEARIEAIVGDKLAGRPHNAEMSEWLGGLDETTLARLRKVGLADGVGLSHTTLGAFLKRFCDTMTAKPGTKTFYGHTRRNLEEFFGAGRILRSITEVDADSWRSWLVDHEKLSPATVARRVIAARTMFRKANRWKLASENPFSGIKAGHQSNDARKHFVSQEIIDRVIAEAPDTEWKLIIALSRYGGLRTPSEHFALRWGDIDWERGSIRVTCPKLSHIEAHATRVIPLFPQLRDLLSKRFDEAPEGTEYVIATHRLGGLNLRQQFERIIARAGVVAWPRLFHNLRASRETELMREYDLATVCLWIGNSPAVAGKHYATSVDLNADFRRASGRIEQAQQNAQQSPAAGNCQPLTDDGQGSEKPLQNRGLVAAGQSSSNDDKTSRWAAQDSNL